MALCSALLIVLAGYTSYWNLHTPAGLVVFGILLVALSCVLSLRLDTWTHGRRRERRPLLNRAGSRWRMVKLLLGGVVIPIAVLIAANVVVLPNHETPMAMAVRMRARSQATREQLLGDAVLRAARPARVQGIRALQAVGSPEALAQLFRILREDPAATSGGAESEALATALASYGARAKPGLLPLLTPPAAGVHQPAEAAPGEAYDLYFAPAFDELTRAIERSLPDAAAQAPAHARLDVARQDLERTLTQLEAEIRPAQGESGVPGLVMRALLAMKVKEDGEILAAARRIAADGAWSDAMHGDALLLVAKLGGKDDLDFLYGQLDSPSPLLQARAMQAIAELQAKLGAH